MALAERDITVEGHRVHLWEGGEGFPILMLHGSGPGAGTIGNWRLVLEPLAARYRIVGHRPDRLRRLRPQDRGALFRPAALAAPGPGSARPSVRQARWA